MESLGLSLYDCDNDLQKRALCILEHLSMPVRRAWWDKALQNHGTPDHSYVKILRDLRTELHKISGPTQQIGFGQLLALAYIYENAQKGRWTIEAYLNGASAILDQRKDLQELAGKI